MVWKSWQEGLTVKVTLPEDLPPLRMLVVLDNLQGTRARVLLWMFAGGIMVLYTPLGASWLNMTESMQRILKRRALEALPGEALADHRVVRSCGARMESGSDAV